MRLAIVCDPDDYEMMSAHLKESSSIVCVHGDQPSADLGCPDLVILWNPRLAGGAVKHHVGQWHSSGRQVPMVAVAIPLECGKQVPELMLDREGLCARIGGLEVALTRTQFAILQYLVQNKDCWRLPATITRDVLGSIHKTNTSLMRFHIHKLRAALGQYGALIRWQRGRGYMFSTQNCIG